MKSKGGATLSKLADLSVLASGKNPLGDAYTIVAPVQVAQVRGIRLEALTHESLPSQGPGRSEDARSNFDMVNFTITAHIPGKQPRPIEVSRVAADHYFLELTANHWNLEGGQGRSHAAVYLAQQPVDCKDGTRLKVQMGFYDGAEWPLQNLGRFRLSMSSDPAVFDQEQTRFAAKKLTDPWAKLAVAYAVNGRNDEATRYFTCALELARHPELRFLEVSFTQVSEVGVRILRDYPANADIRFMSSAEAMDICGDVHTPLPEREMQAEWGPFRWPRSSNDSRFSLRPQIPPATVTEESSHGDRETWDDDFEGAKTMPHTPHPPFGHPLPAAAGRGGDRQAESLTYFTVSPVLWARGRAGLEDG